MGMTVSSILLSAWVAASAPIGVPGSGADESAMPCGMAGTEEPADGRLLLLPRGIESLAAGMACRERETLIPVPDWLDSFLDRAPALRGSGVSFHFDRRSFLLGYTLDLSI